MTDARPRLGFIGIGLMGEGMVRRLLERGWQVTVWNKEPERLDTVVPHGAVAADSPADVAAASDFLLLCVLHTGAVRSVVFDKGGIASAARAPRVVVDMSTIDPEATRNFAGALGACGIGWVDAPVSGGPPAARQGSMTVMAGGTDADIAMIRPIMADLAANFTHMGPVGAGQTAKIINQAIVGTSYVLMAETLAMAEAAGIDAARLPSCLAGGAADSDVLRRIYPRMQQRAFDPPQAYARQLHKDMQAVTEFATALGLLLPVVQAAAARYAAYVAGGNEMEDSTAILRLYEKKG